MERKIMHNEIGKNLNNFTTFAQSNLQENHLNHAQSMNDNNMCDSIKMQETMDFLGTMGLSQVIKSNPSNTTIKAVDEVKNDYEYVQSHISFCNNLVDRGYTLQEADRITQNVFDNLKNKNMYI